ncbi:MAG: ATP-binding domain-containing protein, partial [Syntrophales bacterium]|nr:ATP-binding domain-containing protein [Syntrophales bacterium]
FINGQADPLAAVLTDDFKKAAPRSAAPGLGRFLETFRAVNAARGGAPPMLIESIIKNGYIDLLRETRTDAASREEDLLQFMNFSSRFSSPEDFLSELALLTSVNDDDAENETTLQDRVVLSSIHQAKGLEWRAVLMIWCSEGMMPLARALKDEGGEEEERRLFYVAATRAKDQLYLSYPLTDYSRGMGNMPVSPSRFIMELSPYSRNAKDLPYERWQVEDF